MAENITTTPLSAVAESFLRLDDERIEVLTMALCDVFRKSRKQASEERELKLSGYRKRAALFELRAFIADEMHKEVARA